VNAPGAPGGEAPDIEWMPPVDGVRVGRRHGAVVVQWSGIGELVASPDDREPTFVLAPDAPSERLPKFFATDLLACRRYVTGAISLHGSAVRFPSGRAIALVGASGAGKSSAAMALVQCASASFLADDVVPVDWTGTRAVVPPVNDVFWLSEEVRSWFGLEASAPGKRGCEPRERATESVPLHAIVDLVFDPALSHPTLEPLSGQQAFLALSGTHVCYRSGSPDEDARNLALRARLNEAVPVFRLRRPRSLDLLSDIAYALGRLGESLASTQGAL
jgi:hypothetical protein